jgi:hypothetical protein
MATTTDEVAIVSAQVPRELRDELERQAHAEDRTLSAEVRRILTRHVQRISNEEVRDGAE